MVKAENIIYNFDEKPLFDNLSFEINKDDNFVFIGRSGSGKTTLLMLIAGIISPKRGKILIDNKKMDDNTYFNLRKKMCWLPQSPDIIGKGNVKELISTRLGFSGINLNAKHLLDNMEQLNLSKGLLDKKFESLSGGEKQRFGIMICKMLQKQIILLDEPTSALDSDSKKLASDYLLYSKATVISVSHDKDWIDINNRKFEL